jgi:hypothetical protein
MDTLSLGLMLEAITELASGGVDAVRLDCFSASLTSCMSESSASSRFVTVVGSCVAAAAPCLRECEFLSISLTRASRSSLKISTLGLTPRRLGVAPHFRRSSDVEKDSSSNFTGWTLLLPAPVRLVLLLPAPVRLARCCFQLLCGWCFALLLPAPVRLVCCSVLCPEQQPTVRPHRIVVPLSVAKLRAAASSCWTERTAAK